MPLIPDDWKPRLKEVWNQMSKVLLFVYFVLIACLAGYLTCTLWLAAPKEAPGPACCATAKEAGAPKNTAAAPQESAPKDNAAPKDAAGKDANAGAAASPVSCTEKAGDPPVITQLDPKEVAIGENYANVAVYGCNFKTTATPPEGKVKFNGAERLGGKLAGDHEFTVPLVSSDFVAPGNIAVTVETTIPADDKTKTPSKTQTSNVANLKIKAASDVKAIWKIWPFKNHVEITLELRLILLILFTGAFAASISGLKSFVDYLGDCKFAPRWYPFYYADPFIGAGLAFVFYLVLRGGLLAGSNLDLKAVNPFGFVAVAALVGLFSDAAFMKLNDVADTLFKTKDTRSGKLEDLTICADPLPAGTRGVAYKFSFQATGGTPPHTWTATPTPLPGGLTMAQDGTLSGTPPAGGAAVTDAPLTVQVKDSTGKTATKEFKLTIN